MPAYFIKTSIFRVGLRFLGADVGQLNDCSLVILAQLRSQCCCESSIIDPSVNPNQKGILWNSEALNAGVLPHKGVKEDDVWWCKKESVLLKNTHSQTKDNCVQDDETPPPLPFNVLTTSHNGKVFVFPQKRESPSCHILGFRPKKHSRIFLLAQETVGQGTHMDGLPHCDSCIR